MPIIVKSSICAAEPVLYKGALAADVLKGQKKDSSDIVNFRSILLESHVCKHHHRFLRSRLLILCRAAFVDAQCGGLAHTGTDMASHTIRSFMHWGAATNHTYL
eukprot:3957569-Karenia_brevis.AAC.1